MKLAWIGRKSVRELIAGKLRKWWAKDPKLSVRTALDDDALIAFWWRGAPNWGDALNPVLIRHFSGREPIPYDRVFNLRRHPVYAVVGSILDGTFIRSLEVWGAGFKHPDSRMLLPPRAVHAVRGPLTRERLLAQGIDCPEVYGDPALLYPRLHRPERRNDFRLGVVPHYMDRDRPEIRPFAERDDVRVIDIMGGIQKVAEEICRCSAIGSSSLHGLILGEAYGIPSAWLEFSDLVEGGGFKFRDYFAGVGTQDREPLRVVSGTSTDEVLERCREPDLRIDLERLVDACPFRRDGA